MHVASAKCPYVTETVVLQLCVRSRTLTVETLRTPHHALLLLLLLLLLLGRRRWRVGLHRLQAQQ